MLRYSETRWLQILAVVDRVLDQFKALKAFFQRAVHRAGHARVGEIHRLLQDDLTRCDLLFLQSCLKPLNNFEKIFQGVSLLLS
jgi:hypothetical protein